MEIFDKLIDDFNNSSAWLEFSVLLAALLLAYFCVRYLGHCLRDKGKASPIWFGNHPLNGAMYPLMALALTYAGQVIVMRFMPVFWLRLAVSLLISLAVIRFVARVLSKTFPNSTSMRLVERVFSWLAWGVAVLHSLGLLPLVLSELEAIHLSLGKLQISLLGLMEGVIAAGLMLVVVLWIASLFEQHVINRWVNDLSMRKVVMNITRVVLITVGLLVSLSWVGVDLTALSVMGGLWAWGWALACKRSPPTTSAVFWC